MAKIVFILLVILEIALYGVTLVKQRSKREWARNRLITNGAEAAIFLIMTLLPGVDLSFRFKILLYLLLLRLVCAGSRFLFGFLNSLRKEVPDKRKNPVIMAFGTFFTILVTFLAMIPAFVFADYHGKQTTGSYDVAVKHVILIDQSREEAFENDGSKREVSVHFYYPENAKAGETYPLVVFSHGAFGYYESNYSTYAELASNGYVVVAMDHPYHAIFTNDTDGKLIIVDTQFLNDAMNVGNSDPGEEEMAQILETTTAWGSYYVNNAVIRDALNGQHTYIVGAEHMNFTDLPMFSPTLASLLGTGTIDAEYCMDIVNEIVLKFMDSNLKGEGDYRVEGFYE